MLIHAYSAGASRAYQRWPHTHYARACERALNTPTPYPRSPWSTARLNAHAARRPPHVPTIGEGTHRCSMQHAHGDSMWVSGRGLRTGGDELRERQRQQGGRHERAENEPRWGDEVQCDGCASRRATLQVGNERAVACSAVMGRRGEVRPRGVACSGRTRTRSC